MKKPQSVPSDLADARTAKPVNSYTRRWTIEPTIGNAKDPRFSMSLNAVRISIPERRNHLLLLNAFATVLLTLLGTAGESVGMGRQLKAITTKTVHPFVVPTRGYGSCSHTHGPY